MSIGDNVQTLLRELPADVRLVAVGKTRTPAALAEAIAAGVEIIGENYVQEAEAAREVIGDRARWHFIGHLQKNKVKRAVSLFDMIETVDSMELAREIDKRCAQADKVMPILIEINSGRELQKAGIPPEATPSLICEISTLKNIRIEGLMTVGPALSEPEALRPYFAGMKRLYEEIRGMNLPGVTMKYLSMGITDSYRIAIEEGANIVRIGTRIFGPRP